MNDPDTIVTREDFARAVDRLRRSRPGGGSYQAVATAAGVSPGTLFGWCHGTSLPRDATLDAVVRACHGDPERWRAALARVLGREEPAAPESRPDLLIHLDKWVMRFDRDGYPEDLVHGRAFGTTAKERAAAEAERHPERAAKPATDEERRLRHWDSQLRELARLAERIDELTRCGVDVMVVPPSRPTPVRVGSTAGFWALTAAELVLRDPGSRKWLIKRSHKHIDADADPEPLRRTWEALFTTLVYAVPGENPWPMRRLLEDAADLPDPYRPGMEVPAHVRNRFDRVLRWLIQEFRPDTRLQADLREALEAYAGSAPARSSPRLQLIVQEMLSLMSAGTPRFDPVMESVHDDSFAYDFDVMRYPLTVRDVANLRGEALAADARDLLPYVFTVPPGESRGSALANRLSDFIVKAAANATPEQRWAVPTAKEWLVLAGCTRHPYPWGATPPDHKRANLRFPGHERDPRLEPVRLFKERESPRGRAAECCGNVHEIVVWHPDALDLSSDPDHYRLAGGSFRTLAGQAECRRFRRFTPDVGVPRGNVGVRLIRYRVEDTDKRAEALDAYVNARP